MMAPPYDSRQMCLKIWLDCGNLQGQPVTDQPTNGSPRFVFALVGSAAVIALAVYLFTRPTYADLIDAERSAEANLHLCELTTQDCTADRARLEKAHARVLAATP